MNLLISEKFWLVIDCCYFGKKWQNTFIIKQFLCANFFQYNGDSKISKLLSIIYF